MLDERTAVTGHPALTGSVGIPVDDLYRRHAPEALRVARSITRSRHDAADAVGEAFAGVLEAIRSGRLAGPESFRPYLLAATRNASVDILRRAGRLTPTDEPQTLDGVVTAAGPSDRLLAGEDRALVSEALAELPPRWRAVLWLTEVEGLPPRDVALLLQVTPNNVSQLAVRARSRLRHRYVQLHVRNHAAGDCLEATEHLGGLVSGELTTIQANRVRGHLAECADCRARLAELDDLGLSLRRAAAPLAAAGAPAAGRRLLTGWWPWRRPARGHRSRSGRSWAAAVDPSTADAVVALGSSPAVHQVAASVVAGLLVLGVGAAAVRHDDAPPPAAPQAAVVDPGVALGVTTVPSIPLPAPPEPSTSTTTPTTVTTVATEAPAAAPAAFSPRSRLPAPRTSFVAHALVPELPVYDAPGLGAARLALPNPQRSGAPLVLLITEQRAGWLQVLLPLRPNGSTGWVRADQVNVVSHSFWIVVELGAHRITAYQGTEVLVSEPIGVGTADAPTPGGLYYITELFQPVDSAGRLNPGGPYGPYAYGLSGYSNVLFDFGGGDGQFGIHGTNDPAGLGFDVSYGCIRMSNVGITFLARTLPLGVPVEIQP